MSTLPGHPGDYLLGWRRVLDTGAMIELSIFRGVKVAEPGILMAIIMSTIGWVMVPRFLGMLTLGSMRQLEMA